ncbi:MAG: peptidoglycan editing factor PgeF [Fusobacteriaceae bacterium]
MFEKEGKSYYIKEFRELGIEALYTGADFDCEKFQEGKKIAHGYQTHSKNIMIISDCDNLENIPYPDCDGVISDRKDVLLYTKHADCLAIYFYDKEKEIIGICHSGWKGSFDGIAVEMLNGFQNSYGSILENIIVGIGIGISPQNYEVSEDFVKNFRERYKEEMLTDVFREIDSKIFFDNEKFNFNLIRSFGILEENIICSKLCTYSDKNLHSYRRDGEKSGRNRAYIYFNKG